MPEQKPAWESLDKLYAFPDFADQAAAQAAQPVGAPGANNYIATDDEKAWFDPDPASPAPNKLLFEVAGMPWVMYHWVFAGKLDANQDGVLGSVAMPIIQAAKVNIKPTVSNVPGTGRSIPVPLSRDLLATEKIRRQSPMGGFLLRNLDVPLASEVAAQTVDSISDEVVAIGTMVTALAQAMELVNERLAKIMAKFGIS